MIAPTPEQPPRPRGRFRASRLRDASGQSLVEFALVLLPLCLIIMGIIDFGWIFKNYIGAQSGVRDAARQVAVGNYGTDSTCTLTGAGSLSTQVKQVLCLVHDNDGINDDAHTRVALVVGDSAHQSSGGYVQNQPITICEQYQVQSLTGAFGYITSAIHGVVTKTTTIIESTNPSALPSGLSAETSLGGSFNWASNCPAPAPVS